MKNFRSKLNNKSILIIGLCVIIAIVAFFLVHANLGAFNGKSYKFINYDKYITVGNYKKMAFRTNKKNNAALNRQSIINQVVSKSKMKKYPSLQVKAEEKRSKDQYHALAKRYNKSYNQVIAMTGVSKQQFNRMVHKYAKATVKEKMMIHAIAKNEGIKVSSSDYKKYKDKTFKKLHVSEKQFEKMYGKSFDQYAKDNDFEFLCLEEKVGNYLLTITAKNAR